MTRPLQLELAVQDAAGVRVALEVGADRVELCSALRTTGGLTPSLGALEAAVTVGLPVHALIRCRPGPFCYSVDEIAVMARDAQLALQAGAAGVVIGALTTDCRIDVGAMAQLCEGVWSIAPQASITCHRAMDVAVNCGQAAEAVDALAALGVTRVLTSGGAGHAVDGQLAQLVHLASGRLQIMAGGGVRAGDVAKLAASGVDAVHLSASSQVLLGDATSGPGGGTSDLVDVTDLSKAQAVAAAVAAVNAGRN